MRKTIIILVIIGVALIIISLLGPYYILVEGEQAVVVQFGRIVRVDTQAGLKYKVPFVESVVKYSKKVQSWDGDAQRIPTSENQFIWVDTTARWRISDPKKFYESVGSMTQAQGRMDDVIDSEVRKIISKNPLREAVRDSNVISQIKRSNVLASVAGSAESTQALSNISTLAEIKYEDIQTGRRALSIEMRDNARSIMPQYGMELIDVLIRQIKYSDDLTPSVFDRMIKERNQIAQAFRSDGEGEKAKWLGQTTRELKQIQSDAERKAKEIKAKADAEALAIRNRAYSQDPDFADYWMALEEYKTILPKFNKTLTTDGGFLQVPVQQERQIAFHADGVQRGSGARGNPGRPLFCPTSPRVFLRPLKRFCPAPRGTRRVRDPLTQTRAGLRALPRICRRICGGQACLPAAGSPSAACSARALPFPS